MVVFYKWDDIPDSFEGWCRVKSTGNCYWLIKNKIIHKEDGPACISEDNELKSWFNNDLLHRLDGPAIVGPVYKMFFIHGKRISEGNYWSHPQVLINKLNIIMNPLKE